MFLIIDPNNDKCFVGYGAGYWTGGYEYPHDEIPIAWMLDESLAKLYKTKKNARIARTFAARDLAWETGKFWNQLDKTLYLAEVEQIKGNLIIKEVRC